MLTCFICGLSIITTNPPSADVPPFQFRRAKSETEGEQRTHTSDHQVERKQYKPLFTAGGGNGRRASSARALRNPTLKKFYCEKICADELPPR